VRLAGHAPEPRSLELDDAWPENLGRPGTRRGPVESLPPGANGKFRPTLSKVTPSWLWQRETE